MLDFWYKLTQFKIMKNLDVYIQAKEVMFVGSNELVDYLYCKSQDIKWINNGLVLQIWHDRDEFMLLPIGMIKHIDIYPK